MIAALIKRIKMQFYRCFCWIRKNHVGKRTYIYYGGMMNECTIGDYVHVGPNCILNRTVVGNYSSIAPHVQIGGLEHPYEELSTSTFLTDNSRRVLTEVGHDVWIAAGAIIKTGVKIGNGAVVGANSFVNKDVPPYAIVIGTPAKVYKYRFDDKTIDKLEKSHYWEQKPSIARQVLLEIKSNSTK